MGTWYIHHLKRAGYDYNDILENGQCMTKEKIIFTDTGYQKSINMIWVAYSVKKSSTKERMRFLKI